VPKNAFDLVPNLKETFNQVVQSSAIRSSDHIPPDLTQKVMIYFLANKEN
jgi:hypothetical protein